MKKIFSLIVFGFSFLAAWAQLDNTVEVTNEVKPVVTDVKKVDVKTKVAEPQVKHYTMKYAVQSQPLREFASEPLADYSSEAVWKGNKRGYLHMGGGSHGNVDGQLGYQLDFNESEVLGIDLTLQGFSCKARDNRYYDAFDWTSRDYRNRAALKYDHRFDNGASFYVKGDFENRLFNYMGSGNETDKQHDVLGSFAMGLTPCRTGGLTVGAVAGVDFFSQGRITSLADKLGETVVHADADAAYQLSDEHALGLGLGFVSTAYGNDELEGIARFRFTPHYIYSSDQLRLQLGVFVSTKGNVAPDVVLAYHLSTQSDFYVEARGYETDNTFRHLSAVHPCFVLDALPVAKQTLQAEFHQVDARIGYRFNTHAGFSGNLNAGFDLSKDAANMDWMSNTVNGLMYPWMTFSENRRFYVNADFSYACRDVVKVSARNQLNIESSKDVADWVTGSYLLPVFQMQWRADVKLFKGFYLGLDWQFATYTMGDLGVVPGPQYERPNTVNLGADLRYTLPIDLPLTLFAKGDNLLNQNFDRYLGYRHLGTNFLAGFAVSF